MTIVAGMMLLCYVKISDPGTYGSFIKDVPTKVVHVIENKQAVVEYDFNKAPGIDFIGNERITSIIGIEDLTSKTYGRCRKSK